MRITFGRNIFLLSIINDGNDVLKGGYENNSQVLSYYIKNGNKNIVKRIATIFSV